MKTVINKQCIEECNRLLKGELSATETYQKAIDKYPNSATADCLRRIQSEHREAANTLAECIREMSGIPETDTGACGVIANAVQSTSNLFGEESAIASLRRGEKHGREDYERALEKDEVMPTRKTMIRTELLPKVESHIKTLEILEEGVL